MEKNIGLVKVYYSAFRTNTMSFGFILLRHVNSQKTNKYWNQSVKLLRVCYPLRKIVIIDDNSDQQFVVADHEYKNVEVVQSEYPGRGELLPFVYYARQKWFDKAVIIHDSVFIHQRIPFERLSCPALPLWHFDYDQENLSNISRIVSGLRNSADLYSLMLNNQSDNYNLGSNLRKWNIKNNNTNIASCFGAMCFITHNFVSMLETRYGISNLVHSVRNKTDRCAMERIIGLLIWRNCNQAKTAKSLLGDIRENGTPWGYTYDQYEEALFKHKVILKNVVKVWSGR